MKREREKESERTTKEKQGTETKKVRTKCSLVLQCSYLVYHYGLQSPCMVLLTDNQNSCKWPLNDTISIKTVLCKLLSKPLYFQIPSCESALIVAYGFHLQKCLDNPLKVRNSDKRECQKPFSSSDHLQFESQMVLYYVKCD